MKDSVFLIPGGTSGLGAATGKHLAAAGGRVVIADLNHRAGEKFAAGLGVDAEFVAADVTSEAQMQQAVRRGLDLDFASGCLLETSLFALAFGTADRKQGMTAVLEKRAPKVEER